MDSQWVTWSSGLCRFSTLSVYYMCVWGEFFSLNNSTKCFNILYNYLHLQLLHRWILGYSLQPKIQMCSNEWLEKSDWKSERMGMWIYSGIYSTNNNIPKYKITCDWKRLNKNTLALLIITLAKNFPQVEHSVVSQHVRISSLWLYGYV